VVRQHRYIQFFGMAEVGAMAEVEMARVFVKPRLVEAGLERETKKPKPFATDRLVTAKKAPRRVVILGGPGTGKTTLLEAIALAFAGGSDLGWAKGVPKLLPVFYRIRDLDQDRKPHTTIWDCIQQQCSRRMGETLPAGFFHRQMKAGGLLLLFDGLDEAGSLARRNDIVDMIAEFSEGLSANSRVIVTSRLHDYRHRFEGASWRHYELCEFDDSEIQSFIQGWRAIHEPDQAKAVEKGELLWKALKGRQDILPLARNALLLTMIVRVHFGLGALPDSRLGLYEKCAETLLKHWAEPKGLEPSPIDFTRKHKLLERLAYEMQGEAEQLSDELALQIPRADLARRFETFQEDEGCPDARHLVDAVIDRLHARDAVLVQYGTDPRGQNLLRFRASFVPGVFCGLLDGPGVGARRV
jgi:predicted NACHT family NTPase